MNLDRRLHAFRPDLADEMLSKVVAARRYVAGTPARVYAASADMRAAPDEDVGIDTQLLIGEAVRIFEKKADWAWVQADWDGYVGYVPECALGPPDPPPTHVVAVARSFLYPEPDLKRPRAGCLSMGACLAVTGFEEHGGTRYALMASGQAMIAGHLRSCTEPDADIVAAAELLVGTPYLWGGSSAFGIDCSGLVQLTLRMAGIRVLRDSDMQFSSIGQPVRPGEDLSGLQRGDLVFWKGHVGIMADAATLIHASGHEMLVVRESLRQAVDRIARRHGPPTGFRRPLVQDQ